MTRTRAALLAALGLLTLARLARIGRFELSPDEAYYALWAERLDLAYYSKGPGIALAVRLGTTLLGRDELGVRLLAPLLALGTSLVLWRLAARMFDERIAAWTVIALNLLPIFNVGALLMTIDPLSIFFWSAAMSCAWRALGQAPRFTGWWPLTGACLGAGLLCKYTNLLALVGIVVAMAATARWRRELVRPGFLSCLAVTATFTTPALIWNARHDWVTLRHLGERGGLDAPFGVHPVEMLEFLGAHVGVYSPVLFVLVLAALPAAFRAARDGLAQRYLLGLALPIMLLYLTLSLNASGEANWTGPAFLSLILLGAWHWVPRAASARPARWTCAAGLGLSALVSLVFVDTDILRAVGVPLRASMDPATRVRGWRETAEAVEELCASVAIGRGEVPVVVAHHYGLASELAFYMRDARPSAPGHPPVYVAPTDAPRNQFWFWPGYEDTDAPAALFVSTSRRQEVPASIRARVGGCVELRPIEILRDAEVLRTLCAWSCGGDTRIRASDSAPSTAGERYTHLARAAALRAPTPTELERYAWLEPSSRIRSLDEAFAAPPGFARVELRPGSFGAWLRTLPLRAALTPVRMHDGEVAVEVHDPGLAAVAALDVGKRDLQQCADSIVRLHSEWLWSSGRREEIAYGFTSGEVAAWPRFAEGMRPVVRGSKVSWARGAASDDSRDAFRDYLDVVFSYAGTLSLARDAQPVGRTDIAPGDILVVGGSPGHAVIVLDVARNESGEQVALLGEGFLPAQDFHVLASDDMTRPWYALDGDAIVTPFWRRPFPWSSLRRLTQ